MSIKSKNFTNKTTTSVKISKSQNQKSQKVLINETLLTLLIIWLGQCTDEYKDNIINIFVKIKKKME